MNVRFGPRPDVARDPPLPDHIRAALAHGSLVEGEVVLPIPPFGANCKTGALDSSTDPLIQEIAYSKSTVDLFFASTIHKSQGQTLNRVIVDLGQGGMRMCLAQLYVAFTRVRGGEFLRVFPGELGHLVGLSQNQALIDWMAAMGPGSVTQFNERRLADHRSSRAAESARAEADRASGTAPGVSSRTPSGPPIGRVTSGGGGGGGGGGAPATGASATGHSTHRNRASTGGGGTGVVPVQSAECPGRVTHYRGNFLQFRASFLVHICPAVGARLGHTGVSSALFRQYPRADSWTGQRQRVLGRSY